MLRIWKTVIHRHLDGDNEKNHGTHNKAMRSSDRIKEERRL
jgi:hypothetical protein